jgi:hypothetical protein
MALSYGGPFEIGRGWMTSIALAVVADAFIGPNSHGRQRQYASKRVVPSGEIYVQSAHISQLTSGEGRYLPPWTEFPWDDFERWRHDRPAAEVPSDADDQAEDEEEHAPVNTVTPVEEITNVNAAAAAAGAEEAAAAAAPAARTAGLDRGGRLSRHPVQAYYRAMGGTWHAAAKRKQCGETKGAVAT